MDLSNTSECPTCQGAGWLDASGPGSSTAGYRREDIRRGPHGFTQVRCEDCEDGTAIDCCDTCGESARHYSPFRGVDGECLVCESLAESARRDRREADIESGGEWLHERRAS